MNCKHKSLKRLLNKVESLVIAIEKGYVCQLTSCKFSIPLSDDTFSHIVLTRDYIVVYYNKITKTPIYLSINDYSQELGEQYLPGLEAQIKTVNPNYDRGNLSNEEIEKLEVIAFEVAETSGMYENLNQNLEPVEFTPDTIEPILNNIYNAYEITVEQVNGLFEIVTE